MITQQLARLGLKVALTRDDEGFEFDVTDASGQTVAWGWSRGSKQDALDEVAAHPSIKLRLQKGAAA